ncbi:MAG: hypothetical protein HY860_05080 [Chlamydiales bacterium]|nr:hypothetical protein [Chlamydiales bacterium]
MATRGSMKYFFVLFISLQVILKADDNALSPPLLKLLELMGVKHDGSLSSIVEETQKKWLRPSNKERWEIPDIALENKAYFFELIDQLGLLEEKLPTQKNYDYACVLGASIHTFASRINFFIDQWNNGIRFQHIVFLSSERPLDPIFEKIDLPIYVESDVATYYFNHLDIPQEMREVPVIVINTPMIVGNRALRRPTTTDTIYDFLSRNPKTGSCLFISSQPYCNYQNAVATYCMPNTFYIETVGSKAKPEKQSISVILDTVARWLFIESQLVDKTSHPFD